ncbi:hypothetical protein L1987_17750 [Smallanthus sonchifolius]|uniref:Uncharacterized protein n=1 Tax=Smallanthus sonchifolius TaxID=185202 RepID=A0ACB9IYU9_9ASTR|nr:hypothetical protein L1987_17750 [Smallanthus sonchifolius]
MRPRQQISFPNRGSRSSCLVCDQSIKSSFVYCSMVCKFSTVAASNGGQKVYAYSSNDPGRSLVVSGSVESLASSMESSVEENSSISTTGDATNYSMTFLERVHNPEQKMSTATSSNGITRKMHGRKCVPQRSPFF